VFDDLRTEQALWTGKYVDDHVLDALEWSKEKYKLQIHQLPEGERAQIPKTLAPMIQAYVQKVNAAGLPGDQIIKDVTALKDKYEKEFSK